MHPEHRTQDDLEGDVVHPRQRAHRHARRPRRQLPASRLADQLLVGAHALAVERRQDDLAAAQVLGAVEKQQVLGAQQRTQRHVRDA
jgi:hypothetical protein